MLWILYILPTPKKVCYPSKPKHGLITTKIINKSKDKDQDKVDKGQ